MSDYRHDSDSTDRQLYHHSKAGHGFSEFDWDEVENSIFGKISDDEDSNKFDGEALRAWYEDFLEHCVGKQQSNLGCGGAIYNPKAIGNRFLVGVASLCPCLIEGRPEHRSRELGQQAKVDFSWLARRGRQFRAWNDAERRRIT